MYNTTTTRPAECTIPRTNPEPYADKLFRASLDNAFALLPNNKNWEDNRDDLYNLLVNNGSPEDLFTPIGAGSYKDVYRLNRMDYIVKFCSQNNPTNAERTLLEAARRDGVDWAFIPTVFVDTFGFRCDMDRLIDIINPSEMVTWSESKGTYVENPDWDGIYCNALEIQPAATVLNEYEDTEYFEYWDFHEAYGMEICYRKGEWIMEPNGKDPIIDEMLVDPNTGEILLIETLHTLDIHCRQWLQDAVNYYGAEALDNLATFCKKYGVQDLHTGNLGWINIDSYKPRPVIIDWWSRKIKATK